MSFIKEFWEFLKIRKKYWLLPIIIVLVLFGGLIVLTQGSAVAPFIMAIIFFFVVTPIGLIMRTLGKDILYLKKNNKKTYWIKKSKIRSKMKNQF